MLKRRAVPVGDACVKQLDRCQVYSCELGTKLDGMRPRPLGCSRGRASREPAAFANLHRFGAYAERVVQPARNVREVATSTIRETAGASNWWESSVNGIGQFLSQSGNG